jgi:hypothetical protein
VSSMSAVKVRAPDEAYRADRACRADIQGGWQMLPEPCALASLDDDLL